MSEKKQANELPKPIIPSLNASWLKLTQRIAQTELQLKGGNLTPAQVTQFEAQLNRDRTRLVEVETAIANVNTQPTTSIQDRREQDLNRREGQLRAGEQALVEREQALLAKERDLIDREEKVAADRQAFNSEVEAYLAASAKSASPADDASSIL